MDRIRKNYINLFQALVAMATVGCFLFVITKFSNVNTPSGDDFAFDKMATEQSPYSLAIIMFKTYTARLTNIATMG